MRRSVAVAVGAGVVLVLVAAASPWRGGQWERRRRPGPRDDDDRPPRTAAPAASVAARGRSEACTGDRAPWHARRYVRRRDARRRHARRRTQRARLPGRDDRPPRGGDRRGRGAAAGRTAPRCARSAAPSSRARPRRSSRCARGWRVVPRQPTTTDYEPMMRDLDGPVGRRARPDVPRGHDRPPHGRGDDVAAAARPRPGRAPRYVALARSISTSQHAEIVTCGGGCGSGSADPPGITGCPVTRWVRLRCNTRQPTGSPAAR